MIRELSRLEFINSVTSVAGLDALALGRQMPILDTDAIHRAEIARLRERIENMAIGRDTGNERIRILTMEVDVLRRRVDALGGRP